VIPSTLLPLLGLVFVVVFLIIYRNNAIWTTVSLESMYYFMCTLGLVSPGIYTRALLVPKV
jgi:hypothetical protein